MKVLVVGGSGFLGGELVRQSTAAGDDVVATYRSRPGSLDGADWRPLDIRRREDVATLTDAVRPDVVVNAAYVQADWATTADGAANVALAAAAAGARLVHVSSDAVFSGAAVHYDEASVPDPVNAYGAAKAAAETVVRAVVPRAVIARTSLILGDGGSPQERFVHDVATGRRDGVLFTDDIRCPVHVADLAAALLELAASDRSGIHHVAGSDAVSRYELGVLVAQRDGLDAAVLRTGTRAASGPPGPLDVRLDCRETQRRLRTRLRGAREFLACG
ncbi:NAD-dependent epimerase/dehydratase family protein [Jiangella ureilytica]|uniref:NAD-dependent epimerase/dehydratase family protein n=1 Tax=Jiangella ureilytica TaxID=2530374 RepID=A0A4R4RBF7_9ACTN|nr:sugar nucleotide-binding protein [Jiangella ureilytica]TDC46474.1 NAD-dependent epimerase/dehydratase family protein [Jiangella ureilytica]